MIPSRGCRPTFDAPRPKEENRTHPRAQGERYTKGGFVGYFRGPSVHGELVDLSEI